MKSYKGVRKIHRDKHKGVNGGKIQAVGTSHYFIFRKVALLGVSYQCVKKPNVYPVPMDILF